MYLLALLQSSSAVTVPRDGLSIAADVALVVLATAGVVLVVFTLIQMIRITRAVSNLRGDLAHHADPLLDRGRAIAANVEFISATVRTDVEKLNTSVRALSDRLQQASDRMEERIEEFNALMEVVQGEAEDVFLDTAATVRGVRAGAHRLTEPREDPDDEHPSPHSERSA